MNDCVVIPYKSDEGWSYIVLDRSEGFRPFLKSFNHYRTPGEAVDAIKSGKDPNQLFVARRVATGLEKAFKQLKL